MKTNHQLLCRIFYNIIITSADIVSRSSSLIRLITYIKMSDMWSGHVLQQFYNTIFVLRLFID